MVGVFPLVPCLCIVPSKSRPRQSDHHHVDEAGQTSTYGADNRRGKHRNHTRLDVTQAWSTSKIVERNTLLTTSAVLARYSDLLSKRDVDPWGWLPPEGETFYEVRDRVMDMVRQVGAEHDGQTVVLATHMGPMRALVSEFAGVTLAETYRMEFPSTGVSIFILNGDRVEVEEINGAAHTADIRA